MNGGSHFGQGRVRGVAEVAVDVRMIEIEPAGETHPYPTGAHLDIAVEIAELPDMRSYSLVGERAIDGADRIAVKEIADSRGGSKYVRGLERGATVEVSEPQSHFELQYGRAEYLARGGRDRDHSDRRHGAGA